MMKLFHTIRHVNIVLVLLLFFVSGCGSGGGSGESSTQPAQTTNNSQQSQWQLSELGKIQSSGLNQPNLSAIMGNNGLHLAYFASEGGAYTINHHVFDPAFLQENSTKTPVITLQTPQQDLGLALISQDTPLVIYQGGGPSTCGQTKHSDMMASILENSQWIEYTAAIGRVDRNAIVNDGIAGRSIDVKVDTQNQIHMCCQFFYEGCDSMNQTYPDLWYFQFSPHNNTIPKTVEGNTYGAVNIQNTAGTYCTMALNNFDQPYIFYYYEKKLPNNEFGLKVAIRNDPDDWGIQWVKEQTTVGDISAAWNNNEHYMAVAYYETNAQSLIYAENTGNGWETKFFDDSCKCGNYCRLAFDMDGNPIIAYRAEKSHSGNPLEKLKIARRTEQGWTKELIENNNNIGYYNSILVDDDSTIYIITYSRETHGIYVLVSEGI